MVDGLILRYLQLTINRINHMKNFKNTTLMLMAFGALTFTFTACSSSEEKESKEEMEESVETAVEETTDTLAAAADDVISKDNFAWSSEFDEWVLSGTEAKTITLIDLGDEESGISELGQSQLDYIATALESNENLKALIKGHTDSDQKVGNGRGRAMWTKAKLVIGHDAVGSRIETKGVGTDEPIPGLELTDDTQRRVSVTFTK